MGKRGQSQLVLYTIIGVVVASMAVIFFTSLMQRVGNDTTLERDYLSKDIALLLNTIYASPGDLEYVYTVPEKFHITIKNNLVTVKDKMRNAESSYYFASSSQFTELSFESDAVVSSLMITKSGGTISVKGIADNYESAAINSFEEFVQFANGNKDRHYGFTCREEYSFTLEEGYYIIINKNGNTALMHSNEQTSREVMNGRVPEFSHAETGNKEDFFISTGNWKPNTAISIWFKDKAVIVNNENTKTWKWAHPTIKINELPQCEAEEMAKKRSTT